MGCTFLHRLNIPSYESNDVSYHEAKLEPYFVFILEASFHLRLEEAVLN